MTSSVNLIAPLTAHALLVFLIQLAVVLTAARLLGGLALRWGFPALTGELLAGIVVGPTVLAHALPGLWNWLFRADGIQTHLLDAVGQLGVLLLVGLAGIQLETRGFGRKARSAGMVSFFGVVIPFAAGLAIGFALPEPIRPEHISPSVFALFLGVAVCVTAIPVIAKTLMELKMTHRNVGQLIMTAAMIDDLLAWFLLALVSAVATAGVLHATAILLPLAALAAVVLFAMTIGRFLAQRIVDWVSRSGDSGTIGATVVVLIIASSAVTQAMKLEALLGAFVIGIVLGRTRLEPKAIAPLNTVVLSVLAPVFFATAGLRMDLSALVKWPVLLAAIGVIGTAIIGKFLGAFLGGKLSGLSRHDSFALGAGMNARGVVEVIVATVGLQLGVLGPEAYTILVLMAVVTSIMAPPILRRAMRKSQESEEETLRANRIYEAAGLGCTIERGRR
ncbi:cation:proton antiporter [Mycobacterium sp. 134]|uniref:cation:proton antiporter n=1 Tax=unclassified Mycobacterium TaxID=2642494 RepID=UPI0007FEC5F7|nr:cation:proton antiporter [Mycobacterium sp. E802]OBG83429.1 sodium:proton exchanger [Mycobacterium sp. E802]